MQNPASIEDQIRTCEENVLAAGGTTVQVYTDAAISGGSIKTRPGLQALIVDAGLGRFDTVVAESLDRVSRDQEDIAGIYKRLQYADITLTTLAEGEISELHIGLKGTMNAIFLKDLAQKTRRGLRGRVEQGLSGGGNSYGYRVVRRLLADGSAATGEREIEPAEAEVVSRIFSEYVEGRSARKIAAGLNSDRIPSPRGGEWNASTIHGSRQRRNGILNNEMYVGRLVWNRQRFVKDPDTGKRQSRLNPAEEWITTDVPDLQIIDEDIWLKAQALKSRYASHAGNKRQTKKRLLTGLVKCGCCGGNMTIARKDRYYCAARREKGTCEAAFGIAAAEVESRVLDGLRDILVGNDALVEEFTTELKAEFARLSKRSTSDQAVLQKDLAEVERGITRCVDFIMSGDGAPASVRDRLTTLEDRKSALQAQIARNPVSPVVRFHPNYVDLYRKKVGELAGLLSDESTREDAMTAIRSLVDRIEVRAGVKRGETEVTLVGTLAGILALGTNTNAALKDGGTCLLVAGVGFEPTTFRL
ncbi:recombinase family protein [Roseovarius sp. EGI FJ00037]|uniref:recombinase family protein n=1 Tax=Roseovarius salincola TaxID=2978479 RepID=UPI0022A82B49|nr:recombinase family protein [Roseovarius sp. EGI FJ00037]MCZ0813534.1 recombinase family protein [Roseovarius sp. EGI FJ00037]